jgi:hypothetical protein
MSTDLERLAQLDDEALVQLAYDLGLRWTLVEPAARVPCMGTTQGFCTWDSASEMYHVWNPATSVPQATALFRNLRTQKGWMFSNSWIGSRPEGRQGYVEVYTPQAHYGTHYGSVPETEARALLEVSVCAVQADSLVPAQTNDGRLRWQPKTPATPAPR